MGPRLRMLARPGSAGRGHDGPDPAAGLRPAEGLPWQRPKCTTRSAGRARTGHPTVGALELHGSSSAVPRLPRVYVPRARLWQRLDLATQGALTLLVAPVGAGKTLGVSGWLRRTGRAEDTVWVHADATWVPERLQELLDASAPHEHSASAPFPGLVVIDDAHALPQATLRLIDSLLNEAPARDAAPAALALGPAAHPAGPGAARPLHGAARRAAADGPGRVGHPDHRARPDRRARGAQGGHRPGAGLVRRGRAHRARDRDRTRPGRRRAPLRRPARPRSPTGWRPRCSRPSSPASGTCSCAWPPRRS